MRWREFLREKYRRLRLRQVTASGCGAPAQTGVFAAGAQCEDRVTNIGKVPDWLCIGPVVTFPQLHNGESVPMDSYRSDQECIVTIELDEYLISKPQRPAAVCPRHLSRNRYEAGKTAMRKAGRSNSGQMSVQHKLRLAI